MVEQHGPILQFAAYPKHALLDSDRGNVQASQFSQLSLFVGTPEQCVPDVR